MVWSFGEEKKNRHTQCTILKIFYGKFLALRQSWVNIYLAMYLGTCRLFVLFWFKSNNRSLEGAGHPKLANKRQKSY